MKSFKLILIICLLTTMGCTHQVVKKDSINRTCYIASVKMKTSLRKIILMYIHQHPSYKSYCLHNECSKYYLNNGQKEENINDKDNYVILSPTYNYKGEYTKINNRMPSCYFKLNGRLIFLASNSDFLRELEVMDAYFKKKYASNMSSKEYISNSWLIKVSMFDDNATIIKKNLWGVTNIKLGAPGKFKAPIIKNKIRFKS